MGYTRPDEADSPCRCFKYTRPDCVAWALLLDGLTNPTVVAHSEVEERFSIGLEFLPEETAKLVDKLLCLLADQLNEDQICNISKDRILEMGTVINQIWETIEENKLQWIFENR